MVKNFDIGKIENDMEISDTVTQTQESVNWNLTGNGGL